MLYEKASEIVTLNAEQELRNLKYSDNDDFPNHITLLKNKLAYVRTLGAKISDKSFIAIILNSLPLSWDPVVASIPKSVSVNEVISQLHTWWLKIS